MIEAPKVAYHPLGILKYSCMSKDPPNHHNFYRQRHPKEGGKCVHCRILTTVFCIALTRVSYSFERKKTTKYAEIKQHYTFIIMLILSLKTKTKTKYQNPHLFKFALSRGCA